MIYSSQMDVLWHLFSLISGYVEMQTVFIPRQTLSNDRKRMESFLFDLEWSFKGEGERERKREDTNMQPTKQSLKQR